jgi:hypothetical protein
MTARISQAEASGSRQIRAGERGRNNSEQRSGISDPSRPRPVLSLIELSAAWSCGSSENVGMEARSKSELIERLVAWRDEVEPLVGAIGDTLAEVRRLDSQEWARRIVSTFIEVLERELNRRARTGCGRSGFGHPAR